jgi:hypothetical protein
MVILRGVQKAEDRASKEYRTAAWCPQREERMTSLEMSGRVCEKLG